ncbi:MAG: zinc ribbon domain-containing protein [Ilumatobacteraceae bacterium]
MDLAALLALQQLDTAIEQAVHARDRLPARLEARSAESDVMALVDERRRVEGRQQEAQTELDRIEAESDDIGRTRERLEKQLKTILSPREAEAIQHELQTLAARRDELDDRGLELLEASSSADEELADIDTSLPQARDAAESAGQRAEEAETSADQALAEIRAERQAAADALAAGELAEYDRRRAAFGGIAVATIAHGSCTGCHMELSVAETDAIKRLPDDAVPECPHCARILVR